jgi:integrase
LDRFLSPLPGTVPVTATTDLPAPDSRPTSRERAEAGDLGSWSSEVERFLSTKSAEGRVGTSWLRRMRWELGRLPRLLERLDPSFRPSRASDVTSGHILALRSGMRWEKATFALHFAALRQFLQWAENPIARQRAAWTLPSGQSSHRRWISKAQLERLLSSATGPARVLVALEGLNGLRRVEVLRLRRRDLLAEEGSLRVLGKGRDGGKWRKIPMHPFVQGLLTDHVRGLAPDERLFALSSSGADALLGRAVTGAGFRAEGVRISHHDLRRTFGRIAHESGMDLIQLKNLFGHSSVEMTVHYIGIDADRMRAGLNRIRIGRPAASG